MTVGEFNLQTSLRDLVFILFKRKWGMLTIFLAGCLAAFVWVFLLRDSLYEVTGKVLVRIGHEQALPPTVLGDRPMPIIAQRSQDVNSEVDLLSSLDLLSRVVDRLGLDQPGPPTPVPPDLLGQARYYAKKWVRGFKDWYNEWLIVLGFRLRLTPREQAIAMLQKGILVLPQKESNIIVVRLFLPGREHASVILNTLLDLYLSFRLEMLEDGGGVDFFEAQVTKSSAELREAEAALQTLEETHNIQAIEDQKEILLRQIADARAASTAAEMALREARSKVDRLERELQSPEPDFAALGAFDPDSFPAAAMAHLSALQREREQLRMTELDDGVRIVNNRRQFNLLIGQISSNLRAALAERTLLHEGRAAELNALTQELESLHQAEMDWRAARRRSAQLEATDTFYRAKLEDASARAALEQRRIGNVAIVEHAIDPLKPAGMRKITLLGLSVLGALCAALAWAATAEFFDHRVYNAETLEKKLGAPVVAVIPAMKRRHLRRATGASSGR
jgi:uncharacterized protein involved in exopolysaccharide biosynthesis